MANFVEIIQIMRNQSQAELSPNSEVYEGKQYKGSENDLEMSGHIEDYFGCTYNLYHYPFDTQDCEIVLKLPKHLADSLVISEGIVNYKGQTQLVQFRVQNVHVDVNQSEFRCHMILKRIPLYHIFATYLPTTCILIMALSTLFIGQVSHYCSETGR